MKMRRIKVVSLLALATVLAGFLPFSAGCGKKRLNVVLITMDTTRADHIRCYGYDRVETPTLNKLAEEGVLFERAYSHIPITLPAHTSMMTGTVPLYHGVIDNGGYLVPDELATLAEVLADKKYQTAAFISAAVLQKHFNLDQGFQHWDEEDIAPQVEGTLMVAERKGDKTADAALAWFEENYKDNFFMWVHFYDPHALYDPPGVFNSMYPNKYDGEIAFTDSQIKRLVDAIKEKGLYDRTIIVVIGDHGESLGEHGEPTHVHFVYEATQHVPFIMRAPGVADTGARIKTVVGQADLMPTLLEILEIQPPPDQFIGSSLVKIITHPEEVDQERFIYLETQFNLLHYGWSPLSGLVGQRHKYIKAPKPELYDLIEDPKELKNLIDAEEKIVNQFKSRLAILEEQYQKGFESKGADELPQHIQDQLQALGYVVDGFQGDINRAKEKDPKDYTDLFPKLTRLNQSMNDKDFPVVLEVTEKILERDPESPIALQNRAEALLGVNRSIEAIECYRKFMELHQEKAFIQTKIALAYVRLATEAKMKGDEEKALEYYQEAYKSFQHAAELQDNVPILYYYMGRVSLALNDPEKAILHFQNNWVTDTHYGHLGMALVYAYQGRNSLAEAEFEKSREMAGEDKILFWQEYAAYLENQGRTTEALAAVEEVGDDEPYMKKDPAFLQILKRLRDQHPELAAEIAEKRAKEKEEAEKAKQEELEKKKEDK